MCGFNIPHDMRLSSHYIISVSKTLTFNQSSAGELHEFHFNAMVYE